MRAEAPVSRARRWGEIVALAALFALTLEGTSRLQDWFRYRTPLFAPFRSQDDLAIRDRNGAHGRPNARFQKWVMNDLGMRGPEVNRLRRPATLRIVAVGASETFGLTESPGHEYPRQLEDTLRAMLPKGRCADRMNQVEVLNAALPGMSLPTIEQDLRMRIADLHPDVVTVYPSPVGYLDENVPAAAKPDSSERLVQLPAVNAFYPRVLPQLRSQLKKLLPNLVLDWLWRRETQREVAMHGPGWRFYTLPADRLARYASDLRQVIGTIRSIGAIPVLGIHANRFWSAVEQDGAWLHGWEKFYPRAPGRVLVAFDSVARAVTIGIASDSGVWVADVATQLAVGKPEQHFSDFVHFTDDGAARVSAAFGRAVIAALVARGECAGNRLESAQR